MTNPYHDPTQMLQLLTNLCAAFSERSPMPKIRRQGIPPALILHLLARVRQREIPTRQLELFADWAKTEPEVPLGRLFKRFPEMTVCGEGELIKTFLRSGQRADGEEVV